MYNTGNPVPSAALEDMADNAQTFDALVTKTDGATTDRLGRTRRVFQQILMDMGFQPLSGSFQTGATITARNQTLYDEVSHVFYAWGGVIPDGGYVVPAGSTPSTAGGVGAGAWVDRTDATLRQELLTSALVQRHNTPSLRDFVSVKDYGAIGDGETDDTVAIQSALDDNYEVFFPSGVYKVSSITVRTGKKIYGAGNKHLYLRGSCGVTLSQVKQLGGAWLYGTSLTTPAINAACVNVSSGLHIEGLCFYQDHGDYSAPTDYPYQISDENSTSFWSGVTIKNCMFINSNHGINLTKSERIDIADINGDFFRRGINIATNNDVSRINRIHVWNFAQSTLASAFRQTTSSDYAIYINDADEIFISEIFVWDRLYGIYTTKFWGTLRSITLDAVGVPIVINSPISFATYVTDIKINANNPVAEQRAAIYVTGAASNEASLIVDGVSCWKGDAYNYSVDSTIEIGCVGLICKVNNVNHKYANNTGVLITSAKEVSINDHTFQNYFPNQTASILTTVGIRNESATCKLYISGVKAGVLKFLFDGYCDLTKFLDAEPSMLLTNQVMQYTEGSITAAGLSNINNKRYFRYSNTNNSGTYSGLRCVGGIKNNKAVNSASKYIIAATYKNITALDAPPAHHKFIGFPSYQGEDNFLILDTALHSATRCAIQVYTPGGTGDLILSSFGQTLNGSIEIYSVWMCKTDHIAIGLDDDGNYMSSAPSSPAGYHMLGDTYKNSSPAGSGYIGWVCTASGNPGTWKQFGGISA